MGEVSIAVHGGAGLLEKQKLQGKEEQYLDGLRDALEQGYKLLKQGKTALYAVVAAVVVLEDNPLFNAGKGSVFNAEGKVEMDASVMDGATLEAGAVINLKGIKNPVLLALEILKNSKHVLLSGDGAEAFAKARNFILQPDEYFFTETRYRQWQQLQKSGQTGLDHGSEQKLGTVGAVAIDSSGKLAAATSTGGMTNKAMGRVGDSGLIGAGNYANQFCAVSCTGEGEYFMRLAVAHNVAALIEYAGISLEEAAKKVVQEKLKELGGSGGLIAIDAKGEIAMPFNSGGMFRGSINKRGELQVQIW